MLCSTDPWYWSIDELVTELCHDTTLLQTTGYAAEHYPDCAILESQFRSQRVNGSDFLTKLDIRTLRSRIGLDSLAQRMVLVSLIEKLRQRSQQYAQSATTMGVETLDLNRTCYEDDLDSISHKRQKTARLTTEPSRTMAETSGLNVQNEDWSHLLKWTQSKGAEENLDLANLDELEDEALRASGESSEDEIFEVPDDEDEPSQQASTGCKIDRDEIVNIINDSIAYYTGVWEPNAGVPKDECIVYNPEKMWEDAEDKAERQQFVRNYEAEVTYYTHGLDMLCEQIMEFPGNNADAVRRQCKNLEMTVNNLELARWLLSIYALSPESDNDQDVYDTGHGDQPHDWNLGPQPAPIAQPYQNAAEIIDLGSPPASSIGDTHEVLTPNPMASENAIEHDRTSIETEVTYVYSLDSAAADIAVTIEEQRPILPHVNLHCPNTTYKSPINHGDEPEKASLLTVQRWNWKDLTETQDRKRVVSKAIYGLHTTDREDIHSRLQLVGRAKLGREVKAYVDMLSREESRMHGVLQRDLLKIEIVSRLFFSWWYCDDYSAKTPSRRDLRELSRDVRDSPSDLEVFYDFLSTIMNTTFSQEALQHPERPSQAEIIEISDDEDMFATPGISNVGVGSQRASAIVLE